MRKYFDSDVKPPPGGFHYFIYPQERRDMVQGGNAEVVHQKIRQYRENNGVKVDSEALWRELWAYWCSLAPDRCGIAEGPGALSVANVARRELTKEFTGPRIWNYLSLVAARFDPRVFVATIEHVVNVLLDCPICRVNFGRFIEENPPAQVADSYSAAQWVWRAHNEANAEIGKPDYPYLQGVADHGWPFPPAS